MSNLNDALDSLMNTANEAEQKEQNGETNIDELLKHFFVCLNEHKEKEKTIPSVGFGTTQTEITELYIHLELISRISEQIMGPFGPNYNTKIEIIGAGTLTLLRKALAERIRTLVNILVDKGLLEVIDREQFNKNMDTMKRAGIW